jgi:TolA-binding protein
MSESEKVEERLTEEERARIVTACAMPRVTAPEIALRRAVAKLLHIHDRLQARVGAGCLECNELKRERNETMRLLEKANARIEYLVLESPDQVAGLEARVAELEQRLEDEQEQTRAHVQAQMLAEAKARGLEMRLKAAHDAIDMWGDKAPD